MDRGGLRESAEGLRVGKTERGYEPGRRVRRGSTRGSAEGWRAPHAGQHGRSTHVHVRARPRMPLFYSDLRDNAIPNCKLWTCVRALAEEWLLKRLAISTPAIIDNNIESAAHSALQQIIGVSAAETNETNERRWPLTRTPRYLTRVRASMRPHYLSSGHLLGAPLPPATHDKYVKIHGKSEDHSPNACGTTLVPGTCILLLNTSWTHLW